MKRKNPNPHRKDLNPKVKKMIANSLFENIMPVSGFTENKLVTIKPRLKSPVTYDYKITPKNEFRRITSSTPIDEKNLKEEVKNGEVDPKTEIFGQCEIVLDLPFSMNMKEKQRLRKEILNAGGTISYIVTRKSSFVVCVGSPDSNSTKFKMATKYGIPVVMESYIHDCFGSKKLLDTEMYLIANEMKVAGFQKGKILVDMQASSGYLGRGQVSLSSLSVYPYEGLDDYELIKAVVLKGRSLKVTSSNKNPISFYVLELHAASEGTTVNIEKKYCIFTEEGYLENVQGGNIVESNKQCYFLDTAEKALSVYSQLYFSKSGPPHCMNEVREVLHPCLGTPKFQKLQLEWSSSLPSTDTSTLNLVNLVWIEAIGHLNQYLLISPETVPLWKVDEAESILLQINQVLDDEQYADLAERLSVEFYSILPHKPDYSQPIVTKKLLAQKKDLCQILRDMVLVSESSGWSPSGHLQAKYRALRCHIQSLSHASDEYSKINDLVINSQFRDNCIRVENIYVLHRDMEFAEFTHHTLNNHLLFHSTSPSNLVGILSRGLNLPHIVIAERGIEKTDVGMLGGGIYFTDSASTCIKYSKINKLRNTRFLLVCEVALGKVFRTKKFQTSLTEPPKGYDSIHGVKATETEPSDFQDNEFAIYKTCQQRMKYLVEFSLPEDNVLLYPDISNALVESDSVNDNQDNYNLDLTNISDNIDTTKSGIKSGLKGVTNSGNIDIPLRSVYVRAKIIDLVAEVVVLQEYFNINSTPVEGKYIFPLEVNAAVCGFEAFINNRRIIGKIKEKVTARREYKEAVSRGEGAYLMDEEVPNVFTVSVGNIPASTRVMVKITYILELPVNDEVVNFNIPGSIAPWQQTLSEVTQDTTESIKVDKTTGYFSVFISIDMPFPIANISSPTHKVKMKRTETKAMVKMVDGILGNGFTLCVSLKEIHVPRFWVENHPNKPTQACMLTFYPEFEVKQNPHTEIIIAIDASNSMKGEAFQTALQISMLSLNHLPHNCYFNVVAFGTIFQELFPTSQINNSNNKKKAENFLKCLTPTLGNTELSRVLRYYQLTAGSNLKNIIVISDGHINNEWTVLQNAKIYYDKVRIFTLGISTTANKHVLSQLANKGGGALEYIDPADRSVWNSKVKKQIERTMQVALTNVNIEWQILDDDKSKDSSKIVQAPQQIMCIFNGCRQVVYGFVSNCSLVKLKAEIEGKQYETVVYTSSLNHIKGTMLHTLAARAVIRDWEDGLLAENRANHLAEKKQKQEQIMELSKEYSLVTSLTSFIAVGTGEFLLQTFRPLEDEGSEKEDILRLAGFLLSLKDEDILPYMEYENELPVKPAKASDYDYDMVYPCSLQIDTSPQFVVVSKPSETEFVTGYKSKQRSKQFLKKSLLDDRASTPGAPSLASASLFHPADHDYLIPPKECLRSMSEFAAPVFGYNSMPVNNFRIATSAFSFGGAATPPYQPASPSFGTLFGQAGGPPPPPSTNIGFSFTPTAPPGLTSASASFGSSSRKSAPPPVIPLLPPHIPAAPPFPPPPPSTGIGFSFGLAAPTPPPPPLPTDIGLSLPPAGSPGLISASASFRSSSRKSAPPPRRTESPPHIPAAQQYREIDVPNSFHSGYTPQAVHRQSKQFPPFLDEIWDVENEREREDDFIIEDLARVRTKLNAAVKLAFSGEEEKLIKSKGQKDGMKKPREVKSLSAPALSREDLMAARLEEVKDILKFKGGLPLCNSVWHHLKLKSKTHYSLRRFFDPLSNAADGGVMPTDLLEDEDDHQADIMDIFQCVDKYDGYCEESACLILDILKKPFMPELEEAGLKSLGEKIFEHVRRLLSTLSLFLHFFLYVLNKLVKRKLKGEDELEKLDNLAKLTVREIIENLSQSELLLKALEFVITTEETYPLVYQSLGYRNNWEVFIIDHVKTPTYDD